MVSATAIPLWRNAASRPCMPTEVSITSGRLASAGSALICARQLQAVDARHLEVQHRQVERPARSGCRRSSRSADAASGALTARMPQAAS